MLAIVVRLCVVGAGVDGGGFPVAVLEFDCVHFSLEVCRGACRESWSAFPVEVEVRVGFD